MSQDLHSTSDAELLAEAATVVAHPRVEPADSFVLHAPLELAARAGLLPFVAAEQREAARGRIRDLASTFAATGAGVEAPPARAFDGAAAAAARLVTAIDAGDLDEVDAVSAWLGAALTAPQLRALLAAPLLDRLAAAGHAPILLWLLPRVAPRGELTPALLRPLARELARQPSWRMRWISDLDVGSRAEDSPGGGESRLAARLGEVPHLGIPGSDFIYPLMSQVDAPGGVAESLLRDAVAAVSPAGAARAILRTAARSMLAEPDEHAPYGWSHCLTMPQAVLGVAGACPDPVRAVAVAATYVVGFRAALGAGALPDDVGEILPTVDAPLEASLEEAFTDGPRAAAAAVFRRPAGQDAAVVRELATRASAHHDAHLVKYTLACLDAADWDREHARTYLAAAAALVGWWTVRAG